MLRSLYAGISGMKANQVKLDVIGNNIANCGTTAFKSSRVRFQDMVSQSMSQASSSAANQGGVNAKQVGLGVQVAGIDTMTGQGGMQPTSRPLDVAMDGEGYLMVASGPIDGKLKVNADHSLGGAAEVAEGGTKILSTSYTRDGALMLDDDGHLLTADGFRVMGYSISTDGATADGSLSNTSYTDGKPKVVFVNANGTTEEGGDGAITPVKADGMLIPLSIPDKIWSSAEEGATSQRITTFSIEKNGVIKANLEDGSVAVIGQIAMASFNNPAGLSKLGKNLYQNTSNSGEPVVRTGIGTVDESGVAVDNGAGYGNMLSGMLEMSNVDLAEQFTDMIVASRAFQAAGKTISTGDEILQDIIGLKR